MNATLISALYLLAALYAVFLLARGWRGLLAPRPTPADRNLASLVAFLLLTPPAIYLHELGHAAAVVALGGQVREIGFFLYWGYTAYSGLLSPLDVWIIAAAGPLVTLLLGWIGIGVGLTLRMRPALNLLVIQFGILQMLHILLFYPLLTAANLGDLRGSDFAVLYNPNTPLLAATAAIAHLGSGILLLIGARAPAVRRRYAAMTAQAPSAPSYTPPQPDHAAPSLYRRLLQAPDPTTADPLADALADEPTDGVMTPTGHRWLEGGDRPPMPTVEMILAALLALASEPSPRTRQQAEAVLAADPAADHLAATLHDLIAAFDAETPRDGAPIVNPTVLYYECRAMLVATQQLGAAKYALAILGLFRRAEDDELVTTFGRHPAFTRIAVLALANVTGDVATAGQRLYPLVAGMAQVEIVELLAANPTPDARRWLVIHGLPVGYERYTALSVARACDIATMLRDSHDPEVIAACGAILATLARDAVAGGPAGNLDHYADAGVALERYVARIVKADGDTPVLGASDRAIAMLTHLAAFRAYLTQLPPRFAPALHARLIEAVQTRLADPSWQPIAEPALAEADRAFPPSLAQRLTALAAAQAVGVPATEYLYRWVSSADPSSLPDYLQALGATVTAEDATRFADAARRAIDPDGHLRGNEALATAEPPPWPRVLALTYALEALRPYPSSTAARLVESALRSRAVQNRAKAIAVLVEWRAMGAAELFEPTIRDRVRRLADDDPEPSVRAHARGLLAAMTAVSTESRPPVS